MENTIAENTVPNENTKSVESTVPEEYAHIKGWGIDADPANKPTYPIKKYTGDDHNRLAWERPPLQPVDMEVLISNEHVRMPAVFGNSVPPSGLSGKIRRKAFKQSESEYGHWLPLLLADRINVIEGIVDDIKHGHIPNIFAERGWKSEWKYNRKGAEKKLAVAAFLVTAFVVYMSRRKKLQRG